MRLLLTAILMVLPSALPADGLPSSLEALSNGWGQILYCQALYDQPSIRDRIYSHDRELCQKADRRYRSQVGRLTDNAGFVGVQEQAVHRAKTIISNTRDAQQAVQACREECRAIAEG